MNKIKKIGIQFLTKLSYEEFESFQYLLDYDFEYEEVETYTIENKIIELDIDEDSEEDRVEDLDVLEALTIAFDEKGVKYSLYILRKDWEKVNISTLLLNK